MTSCGRGAASTSLTTKILFIFQARRREGQKKNNAAYHGLAPRRMGQRRALRSAPPPPALRSSAGLGPCDWPAHAAQGSTRGGKRVRLRCRKEESRSLVCIFSINGLLQARNLVHICVISAIYRCFYNSLYCILSITLFTLTLFTLTFYCKFTSPPLF
jgi:hypothetical protein